MESLSIEAADALGGAIALAIMNLLAPQYAPNRTRMAIAVKMNLLVVIVTSTGCADDKRRGGYFNRDFTVF